MEIIIFAKILKGLETEKLCIRILHVYLHLSSDNLANMFLLNTII